MPETADTTAFVEDGMSAEKAQDPRGTAKRFLRDLMVQKWRLLTIAICLVGAAACSVLIPITIGAAHRRDIQRREAGGRERDGIPSRL